MASINNSVYGSGGPLPPIPPTEFISVFDRYGIADLKTKSIGTFNACRQDLRRLTKTASWREAEPV